MEVTEGNASGWELSKENIQPLSCGRKMSFLTHSLDKTDEEEFSKTQRDWEVVLSEYSGPDPLELWLKYIEYLEQSCPTGGKNDKYQNALNRCFQVCSKFPQYRNDRRFVEVYLKAIQNFPPAKRADMIQGLLARDFGVTVSRMYLAISDALEAIQNFQEASKVLRRGIEAGAQPTEYLQDALKNLQYRVAERLAKKMQSDDDEPLRNFGMSVPVCHLTNEAQNIRVALSPSNPCRARPLQKNETSKVPLFQGFNDTQNSENSTPRTEEILQPAKEMEMLKNEQENIIKPKKWCNELMPPPPPVFTPNDLPPVEIYVEEPEIQPRKEDQRKIARGVLSERKIAAEEMKAPQVSGLEKTYRKNLLIQGRDREISFEHLRAKEYMKQIGVSTLRALVSIPRTSQPPMYERAPTTRKSQSKISVQTDQAVVTQPECSARVVPSSNNESILREENAELKKCLQQKHKESEEFTVALKQRDASITELKEVIANYRDSLQEESRRAEALNNERTQLMYKIQNQEKTMNCLEQELSEYKKLLSHERSLVEKLLKEKEIMRQQFEDDKAKMQQEFERERNESLLSFKLEHHRSVHHDEEKLISFTSEAHKENVSPARTKVGVPVVPMPSAPEKLGFTLYESKMDTTDVDAFRNRERDTSPLRNNMSYVGSLQMYDDFAMPPPPPKDQGRFCEEDKENIALDANKLAKQNRALTGILQPSRTAEPMELICTEEEDEDDVILQNQPETVADFNVTDLTRALQLCPAPLVNSTPDKHSMDRTCELRDRRPLAGIDIPRFHLPVQNNDENDLRGEMEPIIYEDEIQPVAGKSHGLSLHQNLSPIPETSKERWSSCTSSSSSTNMTHTRGAVNFSVGSSYSAPKFAPRGGTRFLGSHRKPGDGTC